MMASLLAMTNKKVNLVVVRFDADQGHGPQLQVGRGNQVVGEPVVRRGKEPVEAAVGFLVGVKTAAVGSMGAELSSTAGTMLARNSLLLKNGRLATSGTPAGFSY